MVNCGIVRRSGNDAIKCIDLADEVALAQSADRRIATHRSNLLRVKRDKAYV